MIRILIKTIGPCAILAWALIIMVIIILGKAIGLCGILAWALIIIIIILNRAILAPLVLGP